MPLQLELRYSDMLSLMSAASPKIAVPMACENFWRELEMLPVSVVMAAFTLQI